MKFASKLAGMATALLLISSSASAVVTSWDYSVSSLFTFAAYANGSSSNAATDKLAWGNPYPNAGQSSLAINSSPATGSVDTYLGKTAPQTLPYLGASTSLTHTNNQVWVYVDDDVTLASAVLNNTITLDPSSPDLPALSPFTLDFSIAFKETVNVEPCPVAGDKPCADIFVLTGGLMNHSFDYDDGTGLSTYYVNIFPIDGGVLSVLSDAGCEAAGVAHGCFGFVTQEDRATTLAFGFTISTEKLLPPAEGNVPEPGTLALFSLGLMGLFARRRKQR